ncbi:hypothetical protein CK247_31000, partial [Klebsiella pneumoniae]
RRPIWKTLKLISSLTSSGSQLTAERRRTPNAAKPMSMSSAPPYLEDAEIDFVTDQLGLAADG